MMVTLVKMEKREKVLLKLDFVSGDNCGQGLFSGEYWAQLDISKSLGSALTALISSDDIKKRGVGWRRGRSVWGQNILSFDCMAPPYCTLKHSILYRDCRWSLECGNPNCLAVLFQIWEIIKQLNPSHSRKRLLLRIICSSHLVPR